MDPYATECPSCGWPAPAGAGPCLHCLTPRPAEPDSPDVVDAVALTVGRLRRWYRSPDTPAERAAVRRRLDRQADQ